MTGGMMFKGALLATLMVTPALADGKQDTMIAINAVIAKSTCGLDPQKFVYEASKRSLEFTGLTKEQWVSSVGDMAALQTEQMYANKTIGKFCASVALIYAGVK